MEREENNKTDVIVVGGGPAGISCAITIARAGKKVVLIERGKYSGSKNVFGGAIYAQLGKEDATVVSYKNVKYKDDASYSVIRGKFDRWMANEAEKEGVILVEETVVRELIVENGFVKGVKTELEEYYADIVVLADGVNSLLAKQIGLRGDFSTQDVALSVKEVFKIPQEVINERFNLKDDEGCIYQIFGGPMLGILGLGFLYTNKDSISIGLGVSLSELAEKELKPYELLDNLKKHPEIAPLIKDGELLEYSAHLIPEGGYKKVPLIFGAGVMVCGDAASFVDNLHWEGTNLAMISGKIAGETAIVALGRQDYSEEALARYQTELENTFIIKDLRTYKDLMDGIQSRVSEFLGYYPQKINAFFDMFTTTDSIPKHEKYWSFIKQFFKDRKISELFKDIWTALKLLWSILK